VYNNVYNKVYNNVYNNAYNIVYNNAYNSAYNNVHNNAYKNAYNNMHNNACNNVHNNAYNNVYNNVYNMLVMLSSPAFFTRYIYVLRVALVGLDSAVGIATRYGSGYSGDRIPMGSRFSAPVQA